MKKTRRTNLIKRLFAGAGAALLLASSCCVGLLVKPIEAQARDHVDWPLTWELDHVNVVGNTHTESADGDRKVDFGDGFIQFTKTTHTAGIDETHTVDYTYEIPQTWSVGNESEAGIPFFMHASNKDEYFTIGYDVYYEMVYIGENTGQDFGGGGFKIKDDVKAQLVDKGNASYNFTMTSGDMLKGGLDLWKACYLKNGALRVEETCREYEQYARMRIIIDPYEFYDFGDKNAYVMYSYRLNLGGVSFLEPLESTSTTESSEEDDDPWIEDEDTSAAGISEGQDEGTGIEKEIVEGKDENEKKEDNKTSGDDDDDWGTDTSTNGSSNDWWSSGGGGPGGDNTLIDIDDEDMPKNVAISVAGALTAAGAAAAAGGGAAGAATQKALEETKKAEEKQKKKKKEKYRLYVSKDFGNTLDPSAPPRKVYARIVQVLDTGGERPRNDLTGSIKVSSKDGNLIVKDGGANENGKCAIVSVPANSNVSKGTVTFRFEGEGGAFTKNVIFQIANPEIRYAQDAIAFIAKGKETAQMRFAVRGLGSNPRFEVKCQEGIEKCFKLSDVVTVETGIYGIDITEISDEEKFPGYFESFDVEVTAIDTTPIPPAEGAPAGTKPEYRSAKETFQVVRFQEGIRTQINDLKAYLVVKGTEELTKTENPRLTRDCEKTPAHSRIEITLFTWDEEKQCLTNPTPEKIDVFIEDVAGTAEEIEAVQRGVTNVCEMLEYEWNAVSVMGNNNTVLLEVFQTGCKVFMPPGRAHAKVTVKVKWKKKEFTEEKKVNVITMPKREMGDMANYAAIQKRDQEIMDKLFHMKRRLYAMDNAYEMRPLIHRIELIIDGYDEDYGFYMEEVNECRRLFARFVFGEIGSRSENENLSTYDIFWGEGFEKTLQSWEKSEVTFAQRFALGLLTVGASEIYFTAKDGTVEWLRAVKNYADTAADTDNALKNFTVGAAEGGWIMLKNYVSGKVVQHVVVPTAQFGIMVVKENAKEALKLASKGVTKLGRVYNRITYGTRLQRTGKLLSDMEKKAAKNAAERLEKGSKIVQKNEQLLMRGKEYQAYREEGKKLVEDYAKSLKDPNITEEAQTLLMEKIQCHKGAMNHLNSKEVSNAVRARFNLDQGILKERTLLDVQNQLAKEYNTAPSTFKTFKATSNSKAGQMLGKSSSMDHDFTFTDIRTGQDVPSNITKKMYADSYYKRVFGKEAPSQKVAQEFMEQADQTAVHSLDRESYGKDIKQLMNKDLAGKPYEDIARAKDTTIFKTDEWVDKGMATGGGDGLGKIHEGGRQLGKSNKRMVLDKVQKILEEGKISEKDLPMKEVQDLMETSQMVKQSFDYKGGKMGSLVELETALASEGSSLKLEIRKTADLMQKIQDIQLNYRSTSETVAAEIENLSKSVDLVADNLSETIKSLPPGAARKEAEDSLKELMDIKKYGEEQKNKPRDPAVDKFYENENLEGEKVAEWLGRENRVNLSKVEVVYAKGNSTKLPPQEKIDRVLATDELINDIFEGKDGSDMGDVVEFMAALAGEGQTMMEAMEESVSVRTAINAALGDEEEE